MRKRKRDWGSRLKQRRRRKKIFVVMKAKGYE